MVRHSHSAKAAYAVAAVPAVFLPLSYLAMIVWAFVGLLPAAMRNDPPSSTEPSGIIRTIGLTGYYGTLIQWPFYLAWAAVSRELSIRIRALWMVAILVGNMFVIPWFLDCKYRDTTQTALIRRLRRGRIRQFFEE